MNAQEKEIWRKITRYCAYQERALSEAINKLRQYEKLPQSSIERITTKLQEQDYVNNQRYATIYVRSKLRRKQWGRIKIDFRLREKKIDTKDIETAWEEISSKEYAEIIKNLIIDRKKKEQGEDIFWVRNKIANYIINKGFEPSKVWQIVNEEIRN